METVVIHPKTKEEVKAFEQMTKALNIPFETIKEKSPYNPEFVAKIKRGEKAANEGKGVKVNVADLWK